MNGLRPSSFFTLLVLVPVLIIGTAHGETSQEEAMDQVQQYREAGVIHNIYELVLEQDKIKVTVGTLFHQMTLNEKHSFCKSLSLAYPWTIIKVTDAATDNLILDVLGSPPR